MSIGKSGGRSAGNRRAEGAEHRSTQRQREHVDPPPGEDVSPMIPPAPLVWTRRGRALGSFLLWSLWLITCCLLAILAAAAFNLY